MPYFQELPIFQYQSVFKDKQFNTDYIDAKNIFKRAKLRDDLKTSFTFFDFYTIGNNERPDQVAEKVYGNSDLDWVILISNNITNVREEWPLDDNSFYNYLIDKYGSDENIAATRYYQTKDITDEYNRVVVPEEKIVDPPIYYDISTNASSNEYLIPEYINDKSTTTVTVNLNQYIEIKNKNQEEEEFKNVIVTDIKINFSNFDVKKRDEKVTITIINTLANWPNSWGGYLTTKTRSGNIIVNVKDIVFDNDIVIDKNLYNFDISTENLGTIFKFVEQ